MAFDSENENENVKRLHKLGITPLCARCNIFMDLKKNDVPLLLGNNHETIFICDLYECKKCGNATYHRFAYPITKESNERIFGVLKKEAIKIDY